MPTHPQAQFVPLPPDFDLNNLVENTNNFDYVERLSVETLREHTPQTFEEIVLRKVVQNGQPLIIEGWGEYLPPTLFSREWLEDTLGKEAYSVRDIPNETNIPMTMGHYLRSMDQLTKQFKSTNYRDPKRQRLYMKDIDVPEEWAERMRRITPEWIYYLNDCVEPRTGGDGAIREPNEYGQMVYGKGVAPSGDLMSSLPEAMRAQNMMCYIGHEGTYTAAHREMCGSLGHNIMVETSSVSRGERPGSSIWFMTETKERELVSEYFLSMLGHDIEVEKHFAQVNAWKKAPFNVWVVEQKVGDLILIPPLAPHQVFNRGTRTMKVAWNRTTVDTLELALHEALPRARMVCREEQYKCKAIIYFTLEKYDALLQRDTVEPKMWKNGHIKKLLEDFKRLFNLYQEILVSEMFSPKLPEEENVEMIPYDSYITCSYCRGNIFNRFLTCKSCIQHGELSGEAVEDTYDVCMDCYAMGRSCACVSNLSWVEQWDWDTLASNYEKWRNIVVTSDGFFDAMRSPPSLELARKRFGRKPIAEVCQEQLKNRPFKDPTRERTPTPEMSELEDEVDDEGRPKPRKGGKKQGLSMVRKSKVQPTPGKTHSCHICMHHDLNWKLAFCTTCQLAYCYGVLWRAFDLMPQTVMEDKEWQCPRCIKICSCGKCRKPPSKQKPYKPKGTLLGHDTRKVADFRSVESLVDFSRTNQSWLRDDDPNNPHQSGRMQRLKEKAEADKARSGEVRPGEGETQDDPFQDGYNDHALRMQGIDPSLLSLDATSGTNGDARLYRESYERANLYGANPYGLQDNNNTPGWADAHYELDEPGSYNQNQTDYPSRLLAPIADFLAAEESYPDPSTVGQNRMMGIGYFQQNGGVDRILYDEPVEDDPVEQPSQTLSPSKNPNMLFSDLLDPKLQEEAQPKKRKRIGADGEDPEDVEFFASKRQKISAQTKKHRQEYQLEDLDNPRPEKRLPRRSTGKPQSYKDLGEAAVPIEEDEGPSLISQSHKKKEYSDLELAAQALSRLSDPRPPSKEKKSAAPRKRRSMRDQTSRSTGSPSVAPNLIKTPRKSAWLVRKEAEDAGKQFPSELPKKKNRKRHDEAEDDGNGALPGNTIDLSSDVDIAGSPLGSDRDSLFGEPIEAETNNEQDVRMPEARMMPEANMTGHEPSAKQDTTQAGEQEQPEPPVRQSREVPVTATTTTPASAPKRRGRPPKIRPPVSHVPAGSESPLEGGFPPPSMSIAVPSRAPAPKKMLSLKEKLALKGKGFKIVAKSSPKPSKPSPAVASAPVSAKTHQRASSPSSMGSRSGSTPSVITKSTAPTPAASGWNSVNGNLQPPLKLYSGLVSAGSPVAVSPATMTSSRSDATPPITQEKGPTVVRMGTGSGSEAESSASDSSDDDSIPRGGPTYNSSRGGYSGMARAQPSGLTARRGRPTRGH